MMVALCPKCGGDSVVLRHRKGKVNTTTTRKCLQCGHVFVFKAETGE